MGHIKVRVDRHRGGAGHFPASYAGHIRAGKSERGFSGELHRTFPYGVRQMERPEIDIADVAVEIPAESVSGKVSAGGDGEIGAGIPGYSRQAGVPVADGQVGADVVVAYAVITHVGEVNLSGQGSRWAEGVEAFPPDIHCCRNIAYAQSGENRLERELTGVEIQGVTLRTVMPFPGEGYRAVGSRGCDVGRDISPVEIGGAVESHRRKIYLTSHFGIHQRGLEEGAVGHGAGDVELSGGFGQVHGVGQMSGRLQLEMAGQFKGDDLHVDVRHGPRSVGLDVERYTAGKPVGNRSHGRGRKTADVVIADFG